MSETLSNQEAPVIIEYRNAAYHIWDAICDQANREGTCHFHIEGDLDPSGQPYLYKLIDNNGEYDIERYEGAA